MASSMPLAWRVNSLIVQLLVLDGPPSLRALHGSTCGGDASNPHVRVGALECGDRSRRFGRAGAFGRAEALEPGDAESPFPHPCVRRRSKLRNEIGIAFHALDS